MRQPKGFEIPGKENKVCLLLKAIYGLHQSGKEWYNEIESILESLAFVKLDWCNCVYTINNEIYLLLYVDDIIIFAKNKSLMDDTISKLKAKINIQDLGKVKYLLGVNFDEIVHKYYLHQTTYIEKLMIKFEDLSRNHVDLPLKLGIVPPREEKGIVENEIMRKFSYRTLIGCLSFLADRSRPDISFAVNFMSQFCNAYNYEHWKIVVDIINYVFNTKDYKLNLSNVENTGLVSYSDANWGSNLMKRYSTSGYIILFDNVPFMSKSIKQKCVALSTLESEFIALVECVKELVWFSNVLNSSNVLKREMRKPTQFCDNQSAIYFSKNSVENIKTKHIDIKLLFIRDWLKKEKFELKYICSKSNIADFLTKPISKIVYKKLLKECVFIR